VAPWIGELVVGQLQTFPRSPKSIVMAPTFKGQQRGSTSGGTTRVYNAANSAVREMRLTLQSGTVTELKAFEDEFLGTSQGGRYPIVLVPQGLSEDYSLFGRITDSMSFDVTDVLGYATTEVLINEEPLPRMT
jgi:hypothetical protein